MPYNMHDWTLKSIRVDWVLGEAALIVSSYRQDHEILVTNFSNLIIPRLQEWGPSVSINSVTGPNKIDGNKYNLTIEMQTGDNISVTGEKIELPTPTT